MRVFVTDKHIKDGKKDNCSKCPVALAIQEVVKLPTSVFGLYCRIAGEVYTMPEEVRVFVYSFDAGETVHPFSFDLPSEPISFD